MSRRPYLPPRLFAEEMTWPIEYYTRAAICSAFEATRGNRKKYGIKAARETIASARLPPSGIDALARALRDFNRPRLTEAEAANPMPWLTVGSGCTARQGTTRDARIAAWDALSAAMSILVELPIERPEDEAVLLSTLAYVGWHRLPRHQRPRVAKRFSHYVERLIMAEPFSPARAA